MSPPNDQQLQKITSLVLEITEKLEDAELTEYSDIFVKYLAAEIGLHANLHFLDHEDEKEMEELNDYYRVRRIIREREIGKGKPVKPKYMSLDGLYVWSGRGRIPKFILEHIGLKRSSDFNKNNPEHVAKLQELLITD